jgi:hypothetical protein
MNERSMKDELSRVTVDFHLVGPDRGTQEYAAFLSAVEEARQRVQPGLFMAQSHRWEDYMAIEAQRHLMRLISTEDVAAALEAVRHLPTSSNFRLEPTGGRSYRLHHPDGQVTDLTFTPTGVDIEFDL